MNRVHQASVGLPCREQRCPLAPRWVASLLFLLLASPLWAGNPASQGEQLNYTISYRGVFSAMNWVEIADAVLQTEQQRAPLHGELAYRSVFQVTTARHEQMERFYPLRYRFESYFSLDQQRTLLVDEQKVASKERHEIVLLDWQQKTASRYKKRKVDQTESAIKSPSLGAADANMPPALAERGVTPGNFRQAGAADIGQLDAILDHLSMLHAVRGRELSPGQAFQLPVLDGDEVLSFRVQVEKRESLQQQGQEWDTFKLRFDALASAGEGEVSDQPPIYIWLSADEHRVPVRFASHYALGRFAGELTTLGDPMRDLVAALY